MKIFISYRRADSDYVVGRIYDALSTTYGKENIFKDIDSIPVGVNFKDCLEDALDACDLVLVVMGKHWNAISDSSGKPRLHEESDYVHLEVQRALDKGIPIVPVSVNNAGFPDVNSLPETIKSLALINALNLRPDPDFSYDLEKLKKTIATITGSSRTGKVSKKILWTLFAALVLAGFVGFFYKAKCEYELSMLHSEFDKLLTYYESNEGQVRYEHRSEELKTRLPRLVSDLEQINTTCLFGNYKFEHLELLTFSYVISASTHAKEYLQDGGSGFKNVAVSDAEKASNYAEQLVAMVEGAGLSSEQQRVKLNLAFYNRATAYAVMNALGVPDTVEKIDQSLKRVDATYLQRHPLESDTFLKQYKENVDAR